MASTALRAAEPAVPLPVDRAAEARDRRGWIVPVLLTAVVALAYGNSLHGPFVYDDQTSIVYNATLRHLWPLSDVLTPPGAGATVGGRPVLNLTFAFNYAFGGLDVRGYHLANVLIHLLSTLTLFGLVRRTLRLPALAERFRDTASFWGFAIAGLWAAHPLNTEAVTYVVQRAESLMALFFLLTLYCFARGVASTGRSWLVLAWAACALGMGTKENMAAAPLAVFLYDRAFVSGSIRVAWRLRRRWYLALAATWLVVAICLLRSGVDRGGSVGFGVGVSPFEYLLTQIPAVVQYAELSLWPARLAFDYGIIHASTDVAFLAQSLIAAALVGGGLYALWRYPKAGFLAGTALAILAPTSLIPGTTQMIVEHRMYLPLAAVVALLVFAAEALAGRRILVPIVLGIVALAITTRARNRLYRDEVALWRDAIAKQPESLAAHSSLGAALANAGRRAEAIEEDRWVLRVYPNYVVTLANLGTLLSESGQPQEALPLLERAVRVDPTSAQAHLNLGLTLDLLGRAKDALSHYATAVKLNPLLPDARNDYGDALCRAGQLDEGIAQLSEAIRIAPQFRNAYLNLAAALVRRGQWPEAQSQFAKADALQPNDANAHLSWANFLLGHGRPAEAMEHYRIALQLEPDNPQAHYSLATALASHEQLDAAVAEFEAAIRLRPDYAEAHNNLANTLVAANRLDDAIAHYQAALRLRPADAATHVNLGLALARAGRLREAVAEFETAVRLAPDAGRAREYLAHAKAQLEDGGE